MEIKREYLDITDGDYPTAAALAVLNQLGEKVCITDKEFAEKLHLTPKQFRRVKQKLKGLDFLKVTREGIPATTFYEIDYKGLNRAMMGGIWG